MFIKKKFEPKKVSFNLDRTCMFGDDFILSQLCTQFSIFYANVAAILFCIQFYDYISRSGLVTACNLVVVVYDKPVQTYCFFNQIFLRRKKILLVENHNREKHLTDCDSQYSCFYAMGQKSMWVYYASYKVLKEYDHFDRLCWSQDNHCKIMLQNNTQGMPLCTFSSSLICLCMFFSI